MLLCNYTNWALKVRTMSASLYVYGNERLRKNERENETTFISMSMHGSQKDLNYFALACWVSSSHERVYITALSKKMSADVSFSPFLLSGTRKREWERMKDGKTKYWLGKVCFLIIHHFQG